MDTPVLCFRLYGAMAAWGSPAASGGERPTDTRPSRGAVVGILAAAMGYGHDREGDIRHLSDGIWTGSASHGRLAIAADFRTAQSNPKPPRKGAAWATRREALDAGEGGIRIGTREHVEDSLWRVFVAARPGGGVELARLRDALTQPRYLLCLGRREFPLALPPSPEILAGGLEAAAAAYPVVPLATESGRLAWVMEALASSLARSDKGQFRLNWDLGFPGAPSDSSTSPVQARPVVDDPSSRAAWRFRPRTEAWTTVKLPAKPQAAPSNVVEDFFDIMEQG